MAKQKNSWLLYILVMAICAGACSKYLDVEPKDQYLQEKVFKQRETIVSALQGIYLKLASPKLYGNMLSMGAVDVMGQYYNCIPNHQMIGFQQYNYLDGRVEAAFSGLWKEAYSSLLNINSFIEQLKPSAGVISKNEQEQFLGEAYGLRAMLHFDLLRLYGPVYSENPNNLAIPYQAAPRPTVQPIEAAHTIADKILADIDTARSYLATDPIRLTGADGSLYNQRFNYYAALALDARSSLYFGKKERAMNCVKILIAEAPLRFPWAPKDGQSGDRETNSLFPSEIIFRLNQPTLRQQYLNYFDPTLNNEAFLSPLVERLQQVYEANPSDLRYTWNWQFELNPLGISVPVFIRYRLNGPGYIPLFRISESFLIAAECEPGSERAFGYLDSLGMQRNAIPIKHVQLKNELIQSYQKEFWGEGQMFFCFKRLYERQIPNANEPAVALTMSTSQYVVPIPRDELLER